MDNLIAMLPVQPQDGCVDLAHLQQRRQLIQKLKKKNIAEVGMLLESNWQQQRASTPSLMHHLFPAKAPPEYWSAEYYKVMEEVVEQTTVEESAGHHLKSTAEDDLDPPPPHQTSCAAERGLRQPH